MGYITLPLLLINDAVRNSLELGDSDPRLETYRAALVEYSKRLDLLAANYDQDKRTINFFKGVATTASTFVAPLAGLAVSVSPLGALGLVVFDQLILQPVINSTNRSMLNDLDKQFTDVLAVELNKAIQAKRIDPSRPADALDVDQILTIALKKSNSPSADKYLLVRARENLRTFLSDLNGRVFFNQEAINDRVAGLEGDVDNIKVVLQDRHNALLKEVDENFTHLKSYVNEKLNDIAADIGESQRALFEQSQVLQGEITNIKEWLQKDYEQRQELARKQMEAEQHAAMVRGFKRAAQFTMMLGNLTDSPELVTIGTIAMAGVQIYEGMALLSSPATTGLMTIEPTMAVAMAAMTIISQFRQRQSVNYMAVILQELRVIQKQLNSIHQDMHRRFDRVEQQLQEIYLLIYRNSLIIVNTLKNNQNQLLHYLDGEFGGLIDYLSAMNAQLSTAEFIELLQELDKLAFPINSNGGDDYYYKTLTSEQYVQNINLLDYWMQRRSCSKAFNGRLLLSVRGNYQFITNRLQYTDIGRTIGLIAQYSNQMLSVESRVGVAYEFIPNPTVWLKSANAYLNFLCTDKRHLNMDVVEHVDSKLKDCIKPALMTIQFIETLRNDNKPMKGLFEDYESTFRKVLAYISQAVISKTDQIKRTSGLTGLNLMHEVDELINSDLGGLEVVARQPAPPDNEHTRKFKRDELLAIQNTKFHALAPHLGAAPNEPPYSAASIIYQVDQLPVETKRKLHDHWLSLKYYLNKFGYEPLWRELSSDYLYDWDQHKSFIVKAWQASKGQIHNLRAGIRNSYVIAERLGIGRISFEYTHTSYMPIFNDPIGSIALNCYYEAPTNVRECIARRFYQNVDDDASTPMTDYDYPMYTKLQLDQYVKSQIKQYYSDAIKEVLTGLTSDAHFRGLLHELSFKKAILLKTLDVVGMDVRDSFQRYVPDYESIFSLLGHEGHQPTLSKVNFADQSFFFSDHYNRMKEVVVGNLNNPEKLDSTLVDSLTDAVELFQKLPVYLRGQLSGKALSSNELEVHSAKCMLFHDTSSSRVNLNHGERREADKDELHFGAEL